MYRVFFLVLLLVSLFVEGSGILDPSGTYIVIYIPYYYSPRSLRTSRYIDTDLF